MSLEEIKEEIKKNLVFSIMKEKNDYYQTETIENYEEKIKNI